MRSSDCCSHRLTKHCKSHDAQHDHPGFQSTEVLTLIKQNWSAQIWRMFPNWMRVHVLLTMIEPQGYTRWRAADVSYDLICHFQELITTVQWCIWFQEHFELITICLCAFCVKLLQVRALTTQISSRNSLKLLNLREASRKRLLDENCTLWQLISKVEAMMEKLKEMDESGNRPSAGKIDELMENLVRTGCARCHLLSP